MSIFRREVLDKLSAPEQLDQLMQITTPAGWLGLFALGALLLLAVFWGIFWTTSTTMASQGIVIPQGGVTQVTPQVAGRIQDVSVKPGDIVKPGQTLATVKAGNSTGSAMITVTSSGPGRVLAVSATPGESIDQSTALFTLAPLDKPLEVVLYVPLAQSNTLRPGMEVHVTVSGIPASAFGYLRGTVASVGSYPVTLQAMKQTLGTDELVRALSAAGPPIEVRVSLTPDSQTPSGYKWSTAKGAPFPLTGGTFATATTILSTQQPFKPYF
ncbi:MAG: HlyD family efflux transporter periplasmic adaptor subunit [Dehalococcoidia bacterium]